MLIDTHAHLFLTQFADDIEAVIRRALDAGVQKILLPNIDTTTVEAMFSLARRHPSVCYPMIGLHPTSVGPRYRQDLHALHATLKKRRREIIAIGETGLDFYHTRTYEQQQYEALEIQAQWALEHGLPIVLHTRESFADTAARIRPYARRGLRGVFHCFTGTVEEAQWVIDMGFYVGVGGVVTFKNSRLIEVIRTIGLGRVVLETDAPYLSPHPYRGRRNESARIRRIAEFLASSLRMPLEEVAAITTRNARTLFSDLPD